MNSTFKIPFYFVLSMVFICLFAFGYTLYIGREILIPIIFAIIIAILLNPFVNLLIKKGIGKVFSIIVVTSTVTILLIIIVYFISSQLRMLSDSYPQLIKKFNSTLSVSIQWLAENFNVRRSSINAWLNETQSNAVDSILISENISAVGKLIVNGMLIPTYVILMLYYKPLLLEFIHDIFKKSHHSTVTEVLTNSKTIIQTYLVGLIFEMIIVAVMFSTGLLILGIEYAIILGLIGAFLNIIPYLGAVFAAILSMVVAFITEDNLLSPFLVLGLYLTVQFIDNNFLVPKIVASRVQLNAIVSITVVIIGGTLWGVPGMFLSIPMTAIIKVIFDHIEELKPWGKVLGNNVPTTSKFTLIKLIKRT